MKLNSSNLAFVGITLFVLSTLAAIVSYPGYKFWGQFLSELALKPLPFVFLTIALIGGGIIFLAFALKLKKIFERSFAGQIGSILFALSGLAMIAVGVFPLGVKPWHGIFAVLMFLLMGFSAIALGIDNLLAKRFSKKFSLLCFAFALTELICLLLGFGPVCQKIVVAFFLVWLFYLALLLRKNKQ